jgi:LacI family transcriptional regulator
MKPSLKSIANELGLSVTAVSRALKGHPDIGPETRERVLRCVHELNYHPNLAARSLATGRTSTVGLIVPDLAHPSFGRVAKGVGAELRKAGYGLLIASSGDDPDLESQQIEEMLAHRVDVILIASSQTAPMPSQRICRLTVPCILIGRNFANGNAHFVGVDDRAVGMLAATHLMEQGCRRIAHIRGPSISTGDGTSDRHSRAKDGYHAAQQLLSAAFKPDGLCCFDDLSASGAMRAILEAGLRIPEDIALVGCDNLSFSDLLPVPLSSVETYSEIMGAQAAVLALEIAGRKNLLGPTIRRIPPRLVIRASSQRRRNPDPAGIAGPSQTARPASTQVEYPRESTSSR